MYGIVQFIFCRWISSTPNIYWRDFHFSIASSLASSVKNNWPYMICFKTLCSVTLISECVFIPASYCFDYYRFVIWFEVRQCDASSFAVPAQDWFQIWGYFMDQTNFIIVCSISMKNVIGTFYRDYTEWTFQQY